MRTCHDQFWLYYYWLHEKRCKTNVIENYIHQWRAIILYIIFNKSLCSFLVFENGEYSYKIVLPSEDSRTWFEAEELCRLTEGGHLASITNEDDNRFLNEKIQLLTYPQDEPQQLWLGAIEELVYGAFHWANGEKFEWVSKLSPIGQLLRKHAMTVFVKQKN